MKKITILLCVLLAVSSFAQTEGPNNPGTSGTNTSVGTITWSTTGNIFASDNSRSAATMNSNGDVTYYLTATNFGFSVPAGYYIDGIIVEIEKSINGSGGAIKDNSVKIIKGGIIVGTEQSRTGNWTATDTYQTYGSATDLWGMTWTDADINASNFGVAISSMRTGGGANNQARIDHIRITVYYTDPLPVEFLYFHATDKSKSIVLEWATATEMNNDYFSILKSIDGTTWKEINRIKGSGNSSTTLNYEYIDTEPLEGYNYYLLKQTDYNGQFSYSNIIAIKSNINAQYHRRFNLLGQEY